MFDTPDDTGTVVQLLSTSEQIAAGGVTKEQRAAHRFGELADRQPGILQNDAATQIEGELATSSTVVKAGLRTAKTNRWVVGRKADTGTGADRPL